MKILNVFLGIPSLTMISIIGNEQETFNLEAKLSSYGFVTCIGCPKEF